LIAKKDQEESVRRIVEKLNERTGKTSVAEEAKTM
jgi:hypothetical protein